MKTTIQHKLAAAIIAMLPAALSAQEHIEADIGATSSVDIFGEDRIWEISVFSPPLHQLQRNMVIRMGNGRI